MQLDSWKVTDAIQHSEHNRFHGNPINIQLHLIGLGLLAIAEALNNLKPKNPLEKPYVSS